MSACREPKQILQEVILVRLWTQMDFGGIFKIIQIYERYDSSNKMRIEQHWAIAQTVPYSEQQVVRRNNRTWKMAKWDFAWIIDVRKEMEDSRLNAIRQLITFVKFRLNFSNKSTTAANVQGRSRLLLPSAHGIHVAESRHVIHQARALRRKLLFQF